MEISQDLLTTAMVDMQHAFFRAVQEKNVPFIRENTQKGFIFTSPRGVVLEKESFINNFVLNQDLKFDVFRASGEQVVIAGDAGVVNALLEVKLTEKAAL